MNIQSDRQGAAATAEVCPEGPGSQWPPANQQGSQTCRRLSSSVAFFK